MSDIVFLFPFSTKLKTRKTFIKTHRLNAGHDGGHDEHGGQRDHDPVGEVVHVEEEGHVAHVDQDEGLQEGVGHVELHLAPEHDLDHGLGKYSVGLKSLGFVSKTHGTLHQSTLRTTRIQYSVEKVLLFDFHNFFFSL